MKNFKDLGITITAKNFIGDKVKIARILNKEIILLDYKIVNSKYEGTRLDLQIEINGTKHVTWTASEVLKEIIQKVQKEDFPFKTTIEEQEDGSFIFT